MLKPPLYLQIVTYYTDFCRVSVTKSVYILNNNLSVTEKCSSAGHDVFREQ